MLIICCIPFCCIVIPVIVSQGEWLTHCFVHRSQPLHQSWTNWIQPIPLHPASLKIHFCIVLLWASVCFYMICSVEILHSKDSNHRRHFSNLHWFWLVAFYYVNYWCKWKCIVVSLSSSSSSSSPSSSPPTLHGFWSSTAGHSTLLSLTSWLHFLSFRFCKSFITPSQSVLWLFFGSFSSMVPNSNLNWFYIFQSVKMPPPFYSLWFYIFINIFSVCQLLKFFIISYYLSFLRLNWSLIFVFQKIINYLWPM